MTTPSSPSAAGQALHFIIYSRSYCHLCEDLRDALRQALGEIPAVIEMVDVDADEALLARYDELVPVLMGQGSNGQWQELCHYHLDKARLQAFVTEMK